MSSKPLSDFRVYVLKRRKDLLILSSLGRISDPEDIDRLIIHSASNLLDEESDDRLRAELLYQGQKAVSHAIQNRHYIPRLLLSALVFLLVYFFLSLAVRDPIPMADELVAALAAAVLLWVLLRQRDEKNAYADKLFIDLSKKIKSAEVCQDDSLLPLEDCLYELECFSNLSLADMLSHCSSEALPELKERPGDEVLKLLIALLSEREKSALGHVKASKGKNQRLSAKLYAQAEEKKIDLALIALVFLLDK